MSVFLRSLGVGAIVSGALFFFTNSESGGAKAGPESPDRAELRALTPAARMRLIGRLANPAREFDKVTTGPLIATIVERGSLEPASIREIVFPVKRRRSQGSAADTLVKWVIEQGTIVKQGDRILELDDSGTREQLRIQNLAYERAKAEREHAEEDLKLAQKESLIERRLSEIGVKLAEVELKKGMAGIDKEALELKLEQARLNLDRTHAIGKAKEAKAEATLRTMSAQMEQEESRLRELNEAIAGFTVTAPIAGMVLYAVPEATRYGSSGVVAAGEAIKEGQKLLRICDLKRMDVVTSVHEAFMSRVHVGQKATVRVDGLPDKTFIATIRAMGTMASPQDFWSPDVKVFRVVADLGEEHADLKPGMSADVRIVIAERDKAVQVLVQSVLGSGKETYCFVKTAEGIEERPVKTGATDDFVVEITAGLKAGEEILRDPRGLIRRLNRLSGKGDGHSEHKLPGPRTTDVLISSVKPPPDEKSARARSVNYGLTRADAAVIARVAGVEELIPVRLVQQEVRRLQYRATLNLIATRPDFADWTQLEMAEGRFLTELDEARLANVAVLGAAIAKRLFPWRDAVGETVTFGNQRFQVVGVVREDVALPAEMQTLGPDSIVYLPLRTYTRRFADRVMTRQPGALKVEEFQLSFLMARVAGGKEGNPSIEAIDAILATRHEKEDWKLTTTVRR
jgi:RND family efflux transporter MFP subunit